MRTHFHKHLLSRHHHAQGGQALAELCVCLIGLIVVILAYFLISALTSVNVDNVIDARETADRIARGSGSSAGKNDAKSIVDWDYGNRDIPFTKDDTPILASGMDGLVFITELQDNTGEFNLTSVGSVNDGFLIPDYNASKNLSPGDIFLDAANLASGTATETDPLGKRGLTNLKGAFKKFFGVSSFEMSDTVFIPVKANIIDLTRVQPGN